MITDVLHLGDIAGTSKVFVQIAQGKGLSWDFRDVPAGRGRAPGLILKDRLVDLFQVRSLKPAPRILHINYGVSGYYGWGRRNVVLHLHGTDVRQDLNSRFLGPVVRRSIMTADRVLFSTPDLADAVLALRPDALWLPAPLSIELSGPQPAPLRPSGMQPTIFFASRWDDAKGAPKLIEAAQRMRGLFPFAKMLGIDWGTHRDAARSAGVHLLPRLTQAEFLETLRQAHVVVGQMSFGALGLADLQAMALGRPLITKFTMQEAYGSEPGLHNAESVDCLIEAVAEILRADPLALQECGGRSRQWALDHHGAFTLQHRLEEIYASL